MGVFVLIHGAWHGGWSWAELRPLLEAAGHTVVTPDLPGHGGDDTPLEDVTLDAYASRVSDAIDQQAEPVVLVGHSMGGMVITAAAEGQPEKIRALVYLCAFLPGDGDTLMELAGDDKTSLVLPNLVVSEEEGFATVRDEGIAPAFYGHCSAEQVTWAKSQLVPQALEPLNAAVAVAPERAGGVPRFYIECTDDRAIPIALQRSNHGKFWLSVCLPPKADMELLDYRRSADDPKRT